MDNFEHLISCPICYSLITDQIYQCENGHMCCGTCINHINHCSTCRTKNYKIRNLVLEKVRDNILEEIKNNLNNINNTNNTNNTNNINNTNNTNNINNINNINNTNNTNNINNTNNTNNNFMDINNYDNLINIDLLNENNKNDYKMIDDMKNYIFYEEYKDNNLKKDNKLEYFDHSLIKLKKNNKIFTVIKNDEYINLLKDCGFEECY